MTTKELNSKINKLFNRFKKVQALANTGNNEKFYKDREQLAKECKQIHNVVGAYEYMTDKSALKMAAMCSSMRFVEPFRMLMQLEKVVNVY